MRGVSKPNIKVSTWPWLSKIFVIHVAAQAFFFGKASTCNKNDTVFFWFGTNTTTSRSRHGQRICPCSF